MSDSARDDGHTSSLLSEEDLRQGLADANLPTLLALLVQLTGDLRWLADPYRPTRIRGVDDNDDGGLPSVIQTEIRTAAAAAIARWQAGAPVALPLPPEDLLCEMLSFSTGEAVPREYGPWLASELEVLAAPSTERTSTDHPDARPDVVIIGAGASGMVTAAMLDEAGIPWTILERRDGVGGTWHDNRYPGCGVDTPSHLYSISSFSYDWPAYFASQETLLSYFEEFATRFDLRRNIELGTEVLAARYDEDAQRWTIESRGPDGTVATRDAAILVSSVGTFGRPVLPSVGGLEDFKGTACHTAQWPDDLDLTGKQVAVVGNGATAMQLVPTIAERAASVTVLQRSAQWVSPFPKFQVQVPTSLRRLITAVPLYRVWYRLRLAWMWQDRLHESLHVDPDWEHADRSIGPINDAHRRYFTRYATEQLGDRQDLVDQVIPTYPPYGKRILLDNGWFRALRRPDVTLNSTGLAAVTEHSAVAGDGSQHPCDVIVFATGFDAVRYLAPIEIVGRDGQSIRDAWDDDDAKAYLGCAVAGFPNFFIIYGPNTQPGHGGSILATIESQARYVVRLLDLMRARGLGAVECRRDAYEAYADRVDEAHAGMVWTHPGMTTYYRNSKGRVVVNSPWRNVDFWDLTREPDLDDYILASATSGDAMPSGPESDPAPGVSRAG